jgi:protein subunit release factor B
MKRDRKPILSVTAKDCKWEYLSASSKGGQKANKSSTGVRVTHLDSRATATARDTRSQRKNRELAFKRMCETDKFKIWSRLAIAKALGWEKKIEKRVEEMMKEIKIEVREDSEWVEWNI